jgi:hypothetical protein
MLPNEATALMEYAARLWPRWEPTDEELGVWRSALERMEVPDTRVKAGLARAYESSRYLAPRLADLFNALHGLQEGRPEVREDNPNVLSGVWCVQHETGRAIPLVYHRDKMPPPGAIHDVARAMIDGNEEANRPGLRDLYGGTWSVETGLTLAEVRP